MPVFYQSSTVRPRSALLAMDFEQLDQNTVHVEFELLDLGARRQVVCRDRSSHVPSRSSACGCPDSSHASRSRANYRSPVPLAHGSGLANAVSGRVRPAGANPPAPFGRSTPRPGALVTCAGELIWLWVERSVNGCSNMPSSNFWVRMRTTASSMRDMGTKPWPWSSWR